MEFTNWTPEFFLQRITAPNGESLSYDKVTIPETIGVFTTGILVNTGHSKWVGKVILVGLLGLQVQELAQFDGKIKDIEKLCKKVFWVHGGQVTDREEDYWGRP